MDHQDQNHPAAADPKVDPGANLDLVLNQDRSPVHSLDHRVAASHRAQDQDHRDQVEVALGRAEQVPAVLVPVVNHPVAAMEVDRDQVLVVVPGRVHQAMVRAASAQAVLVARGNRTDRVGTVVVLREAVAARVQQVVAVARAITNGMDSVGLPSAYPIRALLRWDLSKRSAFALETNQRALALTWAKRSTQDAKRVRYE